jgi:CMP-N,N'-diacetyllegionaminic acid synthase
MSFICVIPARGKSKRIKNKNLKKVMGFPLIYYTINQALKSKYIKEVFVSTESEEIKRVAKKYGAITKFTRPENLALDDTKMHNVLNDFYQKVKYFYKFKYIIVLQPTSPLRTARDIDKACKIFLKEKKNKLVSVVNLAQESYPEKIMKLTKKGLTQLKYYKNYHQNKLYFLRNGPSIFIYKRSLLKSNIYDGFSSKYLMSKKKSLDINTPKDLLDLKKIMNKLRRI